MYVVIFSATVSDLDSQYSEMAERLRDLALTDYGCLGFNAVTEGEREIAVSYWPSLDAITAWKRDVQHNAAQALGKEKWYHSYKIDVAKIERTIEYPV